MSLYIPPECERFIRVCTTEEVQSGMFIFGVVSTLIVLFIIIMIKDYVKKNKKGSFYFPSLTLGR